MVDMAQIHFYVMVGIFLSAIPTVISLFWIKAPYGRHNRQGFGVQVANRTGWILMEAPSVLVFLGIYALGSQAWQGLSLFFLLLWQTHYIHRTFIFPFRTKTAGKTMPLSIALTGAFYNCLNSFVNAYWISELGGYAPDWITSWPFLLGVIVFGVGMVLNMRSDYYLLSLRKPGDTSYHIPRAGGFRWVSCPNYLGEILEWGGWALMTFSLAGLSFFVFTLANLLPRALSNHAWYREKFSEYPAERKALIPYLL